MLRKQLTKSAWTGKLVNNFNNAHHLYPKVSDGELPESPASTARAMCPLITTPFNTKSPMYNPDSSQADHRDPTQRLSLLCQSFSSHDCVDQDSFFPASDPATHQSFQSCCCLHLCVVPDPAVALACLAAKLEPSSALPRS